MRYHKKVLPSARAEFTTISQTYGTEFAAAVRAWRNGIVAAVSSGAEERLMDASVEELLERVLQEEDDDEDDERVAMPGDAWEHARQRFREASWRERARAALAFFRSLAPPWELRVSRCTFSALGIPDMLELFAYYEVSHAERCIVFTKFEIWTVC